MVNASLKSFHPPGWEGAPVTERKREQGDGRPAEPPEYQEAGEFFNRTYMTEGLRDLIANGVRRLSGAGQSLQNHRPSIYRQFKPKYNHRGAERTEKSHYPLWYADSEEFCLVIKLKIVLFVS